MTGSINKFIDLILALKNDPKSSKNIDKIEIPSDIPKDLVIIKWLVETIKESNHKIATLNISSIELKNGEFEILADLIATSSSIKNISFSNLNLTSREAIILAKALKDNKIVHTVILNNNKIGDNGLKAFAEIAEKSFIQRLNFSDNNISDRGFKFWLEALKKNNSLSEFKFDNNRIREEGIKALAECLPSIKSIKNFTIAIEIPKGQSMTIETRDLLTQAAQSITFQLKISKKLLPDTLDIWTEEPLIKEESSMRAAEATSPQPLRQVTNESPKLEQNRELSTSVQTLYTAETQLIAAPKPVIKTLESIQRSAITSSPASLPQISNSILSVNTPSVKANTEIINNHKKKMGDTMRMNSEEDKPIPETILENKLDSKKTLELLDQYNKKFAPLLAKETKLKKTELNEINSVIIFGNLSNDKNILTNLLAHKKLEIEKKGGKLVIVPPKSSVESPLLTQDSILPNNCVINIVKGVNGIACDSNYLQDNLSKSDAAINALYLQKILKTNAKADTKFVFTVQDHEYKFIAERHKEYDQEFLNQVRKLAILLKKVQLTENNFSFVVTSALPHRSKEDIFNFINAIYEEHVVKLKFYNGEEKNIIRKELNIMHCLQSSTCIIPAFSYGELNLSTELQNILNKLSLVTNNDSKITAGSIDIKDIAELQTYIKQELKENIVKLVNQTIAKWNKEKNSVFVFKNDLSSGGSGEKSFSDRLILPDTRPLKALKEVFKVLENKSFYPTHDDTTKFLILNNDLYKVLNDRELANKLHNSIDYLKYLSVIDIEGKAPMAEEKLYSSSIAQDNWFESLTLAFGNILFNTDRQLVESFKFNLLRAENAFGRRLEEEIAKFYDPIKNMEALTKDNLSNISNLKELQLIFKSKDIENLAGIADKLLHALTILSPRDNTLNEIITRSITNLRDLVADQNPKIVTEIWQGFSNLRVVEDINNKMHDIIYEKLLTLPMPTNMSITFCGQLLMQLKNADEKVESCNQYKKIYNAKLAAIYCKIGKLNPGDKKEFFYQEAIRTDNSNTEAHKELGEIELKLGKVELNNGHYKKAMEHFQYTNCMSNEKKAFKKALKEAKENNNVQEQVNLHFKHAEYLNGKGFTKDAAKILLNAESLVKDDYSQGVKIYEALENISPKIALKHQNTAADYQRKAQESKSLEEQSVETHTNSTPEPWAKFIGETPVYDSYIMP